MGHTLNRDEEIPCALGSAKSKRGVPEKPEQLIIEFLTFAANTEVSEEMTGP
ncbi:3676_t:CDS:2 [Paraglomus brasilianum]|uniref:3676_t:CDS:1 n=1 Tax=Paraglomus brasilianum TaxID=144538 RepID=A0A9N8WQP1_9GLOM|nr:3676_t:CDS:2 [Paraglomus brasilianum]